jgi:hypothetical protein
MIFVSLKRFVIIHKRGLMLRDFRKYSLFILVVLLTGSYGCTCQCPPVQEARMIVGATEKIHVKEVALDFEARIDTGARTTSIHATEVVCSDPSPDKNAHIGKPISFLVTNNQGEQRRIETTIADVIEVRNSQGVEERYSVAMTLYWQGNAKHINVNLRDRSAMTYKLLIGRDWLAGNYVVNVDLNQGVRKK